MATTYEQTQTLTVLDMAHPGAFHLFLEHDAEQRASAQSPQLQHMIK